MTAILHRDLDVPRAGAVRARVPGRTNSGLAGSWIADRMAMGMSIQLCEPCFSANRIDLARKGYEPATRPPFVNGRCVSDCEDCKTMRTTCVHLLPPGCF